MRHKLWAAFLEKRQAGKDDPLQKLGRGLLEIDHRTVQSSKFDDRNQKRVGEVGSPIRKGDRPGPILRLKSTASGCHRRTSKKLEAFIHLIFCTSPNHTEEIFLSTFHTLCRPTISPYETGADNLVDRRQRSRRTAINGIGKSPSHVRISTSVQHVGLQRQGPRFAQAWSARTSHAAASC